MSLKERVEAARKASEFAQIVSRDFKGRVKSVLVPGHEGKRYQVFLKRGNGTLLTECQLETGMGFIPCPGAGRSVCYHQMAGVIATAHDAGYEVQFCPDRHCADNIQKLYPGSTLHFEVSTQSDMTNGVWIVLRKFTQ